jgi:hypothetical protein
MKPPQKNVKIENKNKTVERRTARCEISPLLKFSSPAEGFFFQEEPKQNKIHQKNSNQKRNQSLCEKERKMGG